MWLQAMMPLEDQNATLHTTKQHSIFRNKHSQGLLAWHTPNFRRGTKDS
jgi:hypothetical protein